jgi:hypothetical protein
MTKNQLRSEINNRLGSTLKRARLRNGDSLTTAASALGLSESELKFIESKPAKIPCRQLYQVIEHYGADARWETEFVLMDIGTRAEDKRTHGGLEPFRVWRTKPAFQYGKSRDHA